MKNIKNNLTFILLFLFLAFGIFFLFNSIIHKKIKDQKEYIFTNIASQMKNNAQLLIDEKLNSTLSLALLLSNNAGYKEALYENDLSKIDFKNFSLKFQGHSDYKHIWFHLIKSDGVSFYSSWIERKNKPINILNARPDIKQLIKDQKIQSIISVGKFDMTFKAMIPLYYPKEFIGIIEVITHFNSISRKLENKHIDSVIVVDKKYKSRLKKPFSKIFIDDYYIANSNVKQESLNYIRSRGIEKVIHQKKHYIIDTKANLLVTILKLKDIDNSTMSYIILTKNLNDIDMSNILKVKQDMMYIIFISILFIGFLFYYLVNRNYSNNLKQEKQKLRLILDSQPYMMITTDTKKILASNLEAVSFFGENHFREGFDLSQECIAYNFIKTDLANYISSKYINNTIWIDYILKHKHTNHKVIMKRDGKDYHFIVKITEATLNNDKNRFIIIIFVDITKELETAQQLKDNQTQLLHQERMASMGEMIGNIAHQWRQPLSIIATASTGMIAQKQFSTLTDDEFYKLCNEINKNAQYLSATIDDFKNFIKGDRKKATFYIKDTIDSFLHLVESSAKAHNIEIVLNIDKTIQVDGYENELIQCLINIFNNAKDILKEKVENNRLVFITASQQENHVCIKIKDNGGGIPSEIIPKVFDPYFTTKHKSQGTGLGLHMTYNLIVDGMRGMIKVHNTTYKYKDKEYKGAEFTILLP